MTCSFNEKSINQKPLTPNSVKSQYISTKTGNYIINFIDKDKDKSNYEAIEIIKCDKDFKKGNTYAFTGLDMIIEDCPIAGRENQKTVFAKDRSGRDNKGIGVEHNIVYMKANGFDASVDDEQLAQYLNNSFGTSQEKAKDNNTNFQYDYYTMKEGTGTVSETKTSDGKMSYKYTSTLFTDRPKPKAKLKTDNLEESEWPNAEFLKNK